MLEAVVIAGSEWQARALLAAATVPSEDRAEWVDEDATRCQLIGVTPAVDYPEDEPPAEVLVMSHKIG